MSLTVAIEGCLHGELDAVYSAIREYESSLPPDSTKKVDLLLVCGDFESLIVKRDLNCMAVPEKYRKMNDFHEYARGLKKAHCPTIFVGGNHEASNRLQALYYGGYVAPDIYFLGFAGCVTFRGLRISGISGIYNERHFNKGHFEYPPYSRDSLRSVYHIRELEVYRMAKLAAVSSATSNAPVDIMLSHDWPRNVWNHGDVNALLRKKPFLREDMKNGCLGCAELMQVMECMRPRYWFAAHLHAKFSAVVPWLPPQQQPPPPPMPPPLPPPQVAVADPNANPYFARKQAAAAAAAAAAPAAPPPPPPPVAQCAPCGGGASACTRFLALDKVLPNRDFLQIVSIPTAATTTSTTTDDDDDGNDDGGIEYDCEWLAVLRATHHLMQTTPDRLYLPPLDSIEVGLNEVEQVRAQALAASADGTLLIPNISIDPVSREEEEGAGMAVAMAMEGNPQTDALLSMLGLSHIWTVPCVSGGGGSSQQPPPPPPSSSSSSVADAAELDIDGLSPPRASSVADAAELDIDGL